MQIANSHNVLEKKTQSLIERHYIKHISIKHSLQLQSRKHGIDFTKIFKLVLELIF